MAYTGTFDHTLDAKNRLTVPAKYRDVLKPTVVLAKGVDACVAIWTPRDYEAYVASALDGLNPLSPEARRMQRYFSANAIETDLDAAGRVMLPSFLLEHGGLRKEVHVTGAGPCLEIWDREAWAAYNGALSAEILDLTANLGQTT